MANNTTIQYPSGAQDYRIPFDYLARPFVVVTLVDSTDALKNRVLTPGNDYRFTSSTVVQMLTSQAGFDIVQLHRYTQSELVVDFRDGSVLTAKDLTNAELQAIHIAEEGRDLIDSYVRPAVDAIQEGIERVKDYRDETQEIHDDTLAILENAGDAGTLARLALDDGSTLVTFRPKTPSTSVRRTVGDKLEEVVSVKDHGAKGDGVALDDVAIQALLDSVAATGGGTVLMPRGRYRVHSPLIVGSNTRLTGEGRSTVVYNEAGDRSFPQTNCIHIGRSREWSPGAPVTNDATMGQLLAGDLSNITTSNSRVDNLTVESNGLGLGVWALNSQNVHIHDIFSINTTTPINIANDNSEEAKEAACINVTVHDIFQLEGKLSHWYDLFFSGSCYGLSLSRLYNNRNSKSMLSEMIELNGTINFTISDVHLMGNELGTTQQSCTGIKISGSNVVNGVVSNCSFGRMTNAIVLGAAAGGVTVANNSLANCFSPIQLNSPYNSIVGNHFDGNQLDIAGNVNGINNNISNNIGVRTFLLAGHKDPTAVTRCTGNSRRDTSLVNNTSTYAALRARKIAMFPADAWIPAGEASSLRNAGAAISRSAAGTFNMYFKLPESVKMLKDATVYGFGGDTSITLSVVGIDSDYNTNAFPVYETTPTQTTAGDIDFAVTSTFVKPLHVAGTYYLKVTVAVTNDIKQIRSIMLNVGCDD